MKSFRIILSFIFLLSLAYPSHKRHKAHKHKKHKVHHVVKHHKPRVHLGVNWHWNRWDPWWYDCRVHERVVVVKDKHETVLEIIEEIEKLAELKEKGLITEEEYQKKKKELLKRI